MKKVLVSVLISILSFYSTCTRANLSDFLKLTSEQKVEIIESGALEDVYASSEVKDLLKGKEQLQKAAKAKAEQLSDVWYDTILEGSYSLTGPIESEISEVYVKESEIYALMVNVYAPAVVTEGDECSYDEGQDEWSNCEEGFVSESFYLDAQGNSIESNFYADFN